MGSCVSVHKDSESGMKVRFSIGKSEKLLMPSPVKEKAVTVNAGDRMAVTSLRSPSRYTSIGSKDEAFFDSQPWLESDCEDDFVSVNGAAFLRQTLAAKHTVGGSQGWDESTDFDSWASAQTFKVGDELEFKYSSMHTVAELPSESAFKSCDISVASNSLSGGDSKVKLTKPGTRFFACGTSGHCAQGMKVKITTVTDDGSPPSASAGGGGSTAPAGTTPQSSAASRPQILGFFALVAVLVALVV